MTTISFDKNGQILQFPCLLEGVRPSIVYLALDTAASLTVIGKSQLDTAGYDINKPKGYTTLGNASKTHFTPIFTVQSLSLLDAKVENLDVFAHDIPPEHGLDGVLGLNFLRHFKVTLDFGTGLLTLEPLK